MTPAEQRAVAIRFLENFNHADAKVFEELTTEDFSFEIVSGLKEFPPLRGRQNFASTEAATLKRLFPEGLKLKVETVICEGEHVAALAAADTIASNGRRYRQRCPGMLLPVGTQVPLCPNRRLIRRWPTLLLMLRF